MPLGFFESKKHGVGLAIVNAPKATRATLSHGLKIEVEGIGVSGQWGQACVIALLKKGVKLIYG